MVISNHWEVVQVILIQEVNYLRKKIECSDNCESCSGSRSKCTSCPYLIPYLHGETSVTSCPPGTFLNNNACQG